MMGSVCTCGKFLMYGMEPGPDKQYCSATAGIVSTYCCMLKFGIPVKSLQSTNTSTGMVSVSTGRRAVVGGAVRLALAPTCSHSALDVRYVRCDPASCETKHWTKRGFRAHVLIYRGRVSEYNMSARV